MVHRTSNDDDSGFSLVELLVVIAVLGTLATVVVFVVRGMKDSAAQAACAADRATIERAEAAYVVENTEYGTEQQLVAAGWLHAPSELHDVVVTPGSYDLAASNECSGAAGPATTVPALLLSVGAVPSTYVAGAVISPAVTVAVLDAQGNSLPASTAAVTISLQSASGATVSGTTTVNAVNGVATFADLSVSKSGVAYTFVASSPGAIGQSSSTFVVTPAAPATLAIVQQPSSGINAVAWPVQPVVTVRDALGNTVAASSATISLAVTAGTGTAGAILSCGTNPLAAVAGVATFAGCKINLTGNGYTLTATSAGLAAATTSAFNLTGPATKVVITQQPSAVVAGASITPSVTVAVQDASSRTVTSSSATIAVSLTTNPGASTLSGTTTLTAANGVVIFNDLSLNKVGSGYKLTATSTGLTSAVSSAFNVTVGTATKLTFTTQPAGAMSRVAFTTQPKVAVQDVFGNTITTSNADVTLNVTEGTGTDAAVLSCTANPKTAVSGVATFAGCKLSEPATGFTLTASSPGLNSAVSSSFDNPVGVAAKLIYTQQPTAETAGAPITPAITVAVEDAAGNVITASSATITMTVTTNPGASTLSGTTSLAVTAGVATFTDLSLNKVGTGYKLTATSTGLTSAVSAAFNITVGTPAKLAFTVQPGGGATNSAWSTQPKVAVQDALGNTITTSTAAVSLTITTGTGTAGAVLTCTANPKAAASGIATFAGCKSSKSGTGYTLTATSPGLASANSATFTVT